MTDLQQAALDYVKRGFSIFPLKDRTKEPRTMHGVKDASNDPAVVQGWWEKWPNANIGLATGSENGLLVVDLDIDENKGMDGLQSLKDYTRSFGEFPKTWTSTTGRGGQHLFFHTTERYQNDVAVLPGVDIRADGGYVVAPPSQHPNGKYYAWLHDPEEFSLAELNDNVRALLKKKDSTGTVNEDFVLTDSIPEGARNDTMFRLACSQQAKGLSNEAILSSCLAENKVRCKPPLSTSEIKKIVQNVTSKYKKGSSIYCQFGDLLVQGQREPKFTRDKHNRILPTIRNFEEAIEFDDQLFGKIWFNVISYAPWVSGNLPWSHNEQYSHEWTSFDDAGLRSYIEARYGLCNSDKIADALTNVMNRHKFNPITNYLEDIHALYWDGETGHIRKLLPTYLGAEDFDYTHEAMKIFMLQAISRAFIPGSKADYTLILSGKQGIQKSSFLRGLALQEEWYSDNFNSIEGDKASEKLRGMWIVELAELLATKKAKEQEGIKAFLTSNVDIYREPYGRRTEHRKRACVFAGTTNSSQYLADPTGARRFLPVECDESRQKLKPLQNKEQFEYDIMNAWAEAMQLYYEADGHPVLMLSEEAERVAKSKQERHNQDNPWIGLIQKWLDEYDGDTVCAVQIYRKAIDPLREKCSRKDINDIHEILQNEITGWQKNEKKTLCGEYGVQLSYSRKKAA